MPLSFLKVRGLLASYCQALTLDVRALALFRIGLGIVSLLEVAESWVFRDAFLSRTGVCPVEDLDTDGHEFFDVFLAAQNDTALALLLLLYAAASMLLVCGFWTRSATVAVWLFALSQKHRQAHCVRNGLLGLPTMW
mmetsp:Transcript_3943/g.7943  ORF Transcript_3943/g.7943 Transcript_3943/m.7943 type:complete len:137 (+) Transcript_3943:1-411(+)